jgi:drug/metabolite transporter (DMT)-like permease
MCGRAFCLNGHPNATIKDIIQSRNWIGLPSAMLSVLRSSLRLPTFAVNQLSLASPLAIGWTLAIFSTVASSLVTPLARGAVVGGLNPVTLLLVRLIIATGLLTGTALVTNPALLRIDRRALWRLGVIGLIAGVEICCFFSSLAYMDATMTAMIKSVQPLVVLLWLMLAGERLTGRHWMRLALSMAGLYLLIGVGGYVEPMGLLLLTLSILLYSAILVLSQWWLSEYDSRVITFYLTSIMTVVIAIWWWVRDIGWQNPTMHGWIVIVGSQHMDGEARALCSAPAHRQRADRAALACANTRCDCAVGDLPARTADRGAVGRRCVDPHQRAAGRRRMGPVARLPRCRPLPGQTSVKRWTGRNLLATMTAMKATIAVIEDALWQTLAHEDRPVQRRKSVKLTTVSGRGLQPGVDLDNSSALLSLMERDDDPS